MPVQGSLRDLSVLEVLQLIGAQRKTIALKVESDLNVPVFLHFREGLMVAAHARKPRQGNSFTDALVGLGHISPAEGVRLVERSREEGRDLWVLALEVGHLDRDTCEAVYTRALEAQLDRILMWEDGKFSMLPPGGVEELLRPGIQVDVLLVDAMRRLDELAAWKQGMLPPYSVPSLKKPDEWLRTDGAKDPVQRAVVRQIDGRRSLREVVHESRLGEHEVYETIAQGVEAGWIEILDASAVAPSESRERSSESLWSWKPSSRRAPKPDRSGAGHPVVRRSPVVAVLAILLTLGLGSSWAGRRVAVDRTAWDRARAQWEEVDLHRLIEVWRYRHGTYPASLEDLAVDRIPVTAGFDQRWDYTREGDSYRLVRRQEP